MKRNRALFCMLALTVAGLPARSADGVQPDVVGAYTQALVYFGTHGNAIFAARLDEQSGRLTALGQAAAIERPTWLITSPHAPVIYSVGETGNDGRSEGRVYSLSIDTTSGKLQTISQVGSGGGGATHLAVDPRSHTLLVANFGGGQVGAIPIQKGGSLEAVASVQTDYGSGPNPRQTGPHAHGVAVDPSGHFILVPDLGADRIFIYRFDPSTRRLSPADPAFTPMPAGSGPRHLVFHPNGRLAYLDTELSAQITSFAWDGQSGRLRALKTISSLPRDYVGERSAAELALSNDGRFLYVSNRGENTLVVYKINPDSGDLSPVQRIPSGGDKPWSFSIDPTNRWLLVANEGSNAVTVFAVDRTSGTLRATGEPLAIEKPVSVAFYPPVNSMAADSH